MSKVTMPTSTYNFIATTANETLQAIRDKVDDWQETYDERESNEPEYDSQIDRWQEALDRLEEKIESATYLADDYENWIGDFGSAFDDQQGTVGVTFDADKDGIEKIIDNLADFNAEYRGLTPVVKKMKTIPDFIHICEI